MSSPEYKRCDLVFELKRIKIYSRDGKDCNEYKIRFFEEPKPFIENKTTFGVTLTSIGLMHNKTYTIHNDGTIQKEIENQQSSIHIDDIFVFGSIGLRLIECKDKYNFYLDRVDIPMSLPRRSEIENL